MAVLNNLYPPILSTYTPAFLIDSNTEKDICKVYFSISSYNNYTDIKNAQVTINYQNNNISALDIKKYPCEIMIKDIYEDSTIASDNRYYIKIKKEDLDGGKFEINQYYKLQIRFTGIDASNLPAGIGIPPTDFNESENKYNDAQSIDSWLIYNQSYFSEWSTVTLIRGISSPRLNISGFESSAKQTLWSTNNIDVIGSLTFADSRETDVLKSYQIKLYDSLDLLVFDSGILYANQYNINEINYTLKYSLQEGNEYRIEIEYETKQLYNDILDFNFIVIESGSERIEADIKSILDNENGRIGIKIEGSPNEYFTGNITIRRSSSESNFSVWEDIHTIGIEHEVLDYTFYDYTIKSGIWYKYGIQKRDSIGNRGIIKFLEEPLMIEFEDIFLLSNNKQLKIKFDAKIQSFQNTVLESKVDTLGSKYPYIKRNGNMNYKQFPISGTITHLMDEENLFTSKEDIYGDTQELYNNYNSEQRINDFTDVIYEREFRNKVMEFLYNNEVKLFRSPTEGNILIKLMNITFTPNEVLGRYIYSFNCMAYEIGEFNLENCDKYNIQKYGELDEQLEYLESYIGQLDNNFAANTEILNLLSDYYQKYAKEGYLCKINYLDYLRIEMESQPYLIKEGEYGPVPTNNPVGAFLGYIIYINEKPIVINKEGIYELKNNNIKITSLYFPIATEARLDYHISISQVEDKSKLAKSLNFFKHVGQCWGAFEYNNSIYQKIWNKYYEKYSTYFQSLLSLDSIKIEANEGTVVYIKESEENKFQKHIIGKTQCLEINNEDSLIEGIYFYGIHLEEANDYEKLRDNLPNNKFINTGIVLNDYQKEGKNFIKNGVYTFTQDYLNAFIQSSGLYKLKIRKEDNKNNLAVVLNNRVIKKDNNDNILILNPIETYVKDDSLLIGEDSIELYKTIEKEDLYIDTKSNWKKVTGEDFGLNAAYVYDGNTIVIDKKETESKSKSFILSNLNLEENYGLEIIYASNENTVVVEEEEVDNNTSSFVLSDFNREDITVTEDEMRIVNYNKDCGYMLETSSSEDDTNAIVSSKNIKDDAVSLAINKQAKSTYELTLHKYYDKIFALLLEQELNNTNKYIWYNNQWWAFTDDNDIICPVEALIDYTCEIMKGNYAIWETNMNI